MRSFITRTVWKNFSKKLLLFLKDKIISQPQLLNITVVLYYCNVYFSSMSRDASKKWSNYRENHRPRKIHKQFIQKLQTACFRLPFFKLKLFVCCCFSSLYMPPYRDLQKYRTNRHQYVLYQL